MLSDKLKKGILLFVFALMTLGVFAASGDVSDLKTRYMDKAEAAFEDGNITDAYKNINAALRLASEDASVITFARMVYRQKLEQLLEKFDELELVDVQTNLEKYPTVQDTNIKKLLRQIEIAQEEAAKAEQKAEKEAQEKKETERFEAQARLNREQIDASRAQAEATNAQAEETRKLQEEQAKTNEAMREQSDAIKQQNEALNKGLQDINTGIQASAEQSRHSTKIIALSIIGIAILIFVIILIGIAIAHSSFKQSQQRQDQYMQAFKMIAANQNQTNRLMLGGVTDLYNASNPTLRLAGASTWKPALGLPDVEFSEEDQEALKELAVKCEEIGAQIDQATGRKNNSKNVSELVYKVSIKLGLPQGMAMLNFCASMIYDAGFLGMDPELLTAESLTDEQKMAMKEHVNLAEKYLDFVPKKYWSVFEDAAMKHHENIDGTGYPKGLKGDEIPQIARLIRVVETYVSLSSKRSYRDAMDKETAIAKLREQPHFYDSAVVDALDAIV